MSERRFPPPWSVEELNDACFVVRDNNEQALAYIYYDDEPGRRSAAKLLTKDAVRRIAANIAKPRTSGLVQARKKILARTLASVVPSPGLCIEF